MTVELRRLTIKRGGGVRQGGGDREQWSLTIRESTISDSVVDGDGAGIGAGGIHNRILGDLTLIDSTVSGNGTVEGVGGGIGNDVGAKLTVIDSTVSGNATADQGGAGIANLGSATISGSSDLRERCQLQCRRPPERTDGRSHRGRQRHLRERRTEWPRRRDRQLWRDGVHRDHDGFGKRRRELSWWRDLQRPLGHDEVDGEHGLEEQQPIPIRRYRERGHADDREQHDLRKQRALQRRGAWSWRPATLVMLNSTVSGNSAGNWAGGIGGDWVPELTVIASTIADNVADTGWQRNRLAPRGSAHDSK